MEVLRRNEAIRYSPFDLAQYIYWTGDEAGVANVVEEFVKNDMVSLKLHFSNLFIVFFLDV